MAEENNQNTGQNQNPQNTGQGDPLDGKIVMTQEEYNANLAKHKRGLQSELQSSKQKAQAFDQLQAQVSELLSSGLIDGVEDLEGFRQAASTLISEQRSETERLSLEQKQLEKKYAAAQEEAKAFRTRFESAAIQRALSDAAAPKAYDAGAIELIQLKLSQTAKVDPETGAVSVEMEVKGDDGQVSKKFVTPDEAVAIMEANPSKYRSLFKSTVTGGTGEQVDGVHRTPEGGIDFSKLDFEKYVELMKKSPNAVNAAMGSLAR